MKNTTELLKPDELLDATSLAKRLDVSVKTVRKWRYMGDLPAVKVGKRLIRFRWSDVQEFLGGAL